MSAAEVKDRLIVALDLPEAGQARELVALLGEGVTFYKIGMELAYGGGLALVEELASQGKQVFIDLKLHDIGNTVEKATAQIAKLGASFLTIHAFPQTMAAAKRGAQGSQLKLLGVTVMTSYDDSDLEAAGFRLTVREMVALQAMHAMKARIDGLILSPQELTAARALVGRSMLLVTPGVRPAGSAPGDQKRVATPAEAFKRGADYIVVGRPILQAPDPRKAAEAIQKEIAAALAGKK